MQPTLRIATAQQHLEGEKLRRSLAPELTTTETLLQGVSDLNELPAWSERRLSLPIAQDGFALADPVTQLANRAVAPRISIGICYVAGDQPLASHKFDAAGRRYLDFEPDECRLTFEHRRTIIANILDTYCRNGQMANEPNFDATAAAFCDQWRTLSMPNTV